MPSLSPRPLRRFIAANPWVVPAITRVHRWAYQALDGRFVASTGGSKILLLTTTGRRSGEPRTTPLLYVEDGERRIVVASNGGTERVPAWWRNLQAEPRAHVQAGRRHCDVVAREATPAEVEHLWPRLTAAYEFFDEYRTRTERTIPVVLLEPVAPAQRG